MTGKESLFDSLREEAWQIDQSHAHDEYLGQDRDASQVARDVHRLALLFVRLTDILEGVVLIQKETEADA